MSCKFELVKFEI